MSTKQRKETEAEMAEEYEAMWDEDKELAELALEAQKENLVHHPTTCRK